MRAGMDVAIPLTPMQRRFMLALQARLAARPDVGPTYEELRSDMGFASRSSVARLVDECERRGRIARMSAVKGAGRCLRVVRPVLEDPSDAAGPASPAPTLISSFSDRDIVREAFRRGLIVLVGDDAPPR